MNAIKLFSCCVIPGMIFLGASCASKSDIKEEAPKPEVQQAVPVKTMVVSKESVTRNIDFTSSLIPFEEVHLAPASPGRIEKLHVEIGDFVKQDQIVALMDRTNLEQARINLLNLETTFHRLDTLKKTNSIADQQYDQAKSAFDLAKNSYEYLVKNTQLKAPFAGVVSGKYFEDGEIYSGAPVAAAGKPAILSIVQINQLKALIGISESYYPVVAKGMKAEVTCEIYPGQQFYGEIYRIYPMVDNATKTFTVEVKVQNGNLKLRPGMFSKIRLNLGKGDALLAPSLALIKQTGTNDMYVFLNKNNVAVKTPVKTGRMFDDRTEILEGVNPGDEIIVVGQNKLEDQMPISINN